MTAAPRKTYRTHTLPMRELLHSRFPQAFEGKGAKFKPPLAIGIYDQIREAAPDISRKALRWALADYCGSYTYLQWCIVGVTRINIDGSLAQPITEKEAAFAAAKLKRDSARRAGVIRARQRSKLEGTENGGL